MWDILYRPKRFADVLGQAGTVAVLRARLRNGEALDTSYLLKGGAGQGKTSIARIFARAILCPNRDPETQEPCDACDSCRDVLADTSPAFSERDAATQGTVEHVRGILEDLPFAVQGATKRIYLFDECHRMSAPAQDALLKVIEEKRLMGIFCTTDETKVQGPIRSRCEEHTIQKVSLDLIFTKMQTVLVEQKVGYDPDAVKAVIASCKGHVRSVYNALETLAQTGDITVESVRDFLGLHLLELYYDILLSLGDQAQLCTLIETACDRVSPDEVAAGLAGVALATYRRAMRLPVENLITSPHKAQALVDMYGVGVIRLAEFFSRLRPQSMTSLLSELLLHGPLGAQLAEVRLPVVVTQVVTQYAQAQGVEPELALLQAPAADAVPVYAAPVYVAPPSLAPAPPSPRVAPAMMQAGNLGDDPYALTEQDKNAVPKDFPLKRSAKSLGEHGVVNLGVVSRDDVEKTPIASAVWRQAFIQAFFRGAAPQ